MSAKDYRICPALFNAYIAKTSCLVMNGGTSMRKFANKNDGILISIIPQEIKIGVDRLCYAIYRITEDLYQPLYNGKVDNLVDSYKEAVEAALKYSLENLI